MPEKKMPPYSEEAEKGVLGAVLLEPERVLDVCIEKKMTLDDFYSPAHKLIFKTMGNMMGKRVGIDTLTLMEQMKRDGTLEQIGGSSFLEKLIDGTPTAAHAEEYMDEVKRKALSRRIIMECRQTEDSAFGCEDPEELRSRAEAHFTTMDQKVKKLELHTVFGEIRADVKSGREGKPVERGIPTGYYCIDKQNSGGLRNGQVYWLSGNEKTGKTSLKSNIIIRQLLAGRRVGDITLEMPYRDEVEKLTGIHTNQNVSNAMESDALISDGAMDQAEQLLVKSGRLHIMDRQMVRTTTDFLSACRRLVYRYKVDLITLDYFQKLKVDDEHRKSLEEKTTEKSQAVVDVADMLQIPIICVAAIEQKTGKIRGSRMADYDGAAHWSLSREEEVHPQSPMFMQDITIFTKASRYGASFGKTVLQFCGLTGRFEEPDDRPQQELGLDKDSRDD